MRQATTTQQHGACGQKRAGGAYIEREVVAPLVLGTRVLPLDGERVAVDHLLGFDQAPRPRQPEAGAERASRRADDGGHPPLWCCADRACVCAPAAAHARACMRGVGALPTSPDLPLSLSNMKPRNLPLLLALLFAACASPTAAAALKRSASSASSSSGPAAAGEWRKAVDPNSGRTYYWNTKTRESRWALPEGQTVGPAAADASSAAYSADDAAVASSSSSTSSSVPIHQRAGLAVKQSLTGCRSAVSSLTSAMAAKTRGDDGEARSGAFVPKLVYLCTLYTVAAAVL